MSLPCRSCNADSRVTKTVRKLLEKGSIAAIVNERNHSCPACGERFTSREFYSSPNVTSSQQQVNKDRRILLDRELDDAKRNDAMAAGHPLPQLDTACPHCLTSQAKTIKSGEGCLVLPDETLVYWRWHKCNNCRKRFCSYTSLFDGRTTTAKKAYSRPTQTAMKAAAQRMLYEREHGVPAAPPVAVQDSVAVPKPPLPMPVTSTAEEDDAAYDAAFDAELEAAMRKRGIAPPTPTASDDDAAFDAELDQIAKQFE